MNASRARRLDARAERRAIIALFALFALLVQALTPSLAAAATGGRDPICVATGLASGQPGDSAPMGHGAGGGCDHCVCPVTVAPPSVVEAASQPIRYAVMAAYRPTLRSVCAPGRGLAAPPPPSRGPPSLI